MKIWALMAVLVWVGCGSTATDVLPTPEPDPAPDARPTGPGSCSEQLCRDYGACAWREETRTCAPRSDEDCLLAVVACEKMGACHMARGECRVKAEDDRDCSRPRGALLVDWCRVKGLCTALEGVCIATRDAHCEASYGCELSGLCGLAGGRCLALDDAHCEASIRCKKKGRCEARSGQCVAP